ncbi:DUF255 domain-containing protein [Thiomicrorhabdus sp. ZW0627]|uniref:thioredoxin domain-containing protein n=1 Tax=Thiomicrorhabdus sp. ZW0627 TaxID=3039774 RepID=UPI00243632A2|nr:DUF255 domain-containing protein [Thiomicrorhabdus sp. ZW0627]MDG6774535.1 DUF255 domain-containing protein [Thiomicrorhabdus sp. ZW0627]
MPVLASQTSDTSNLSSNLLLKHPSPYLAMHAKDPVHWQVWRSETLKQAQRLNRPILISSGYFACHWCHVMQKENYQELQAAELMNRLVIPVKIDRELTPDLDDYLIDFSRRVTGKAGWPLHVVLTPEGYPFAAFGYLPNKEFKNTLIQIDRLWNSQQTKIRSLAKQSMPGHTGKATKAISLNEFQLHFNHHLEQSMDDLSGGLKGSHKFPQAPLLLALLHQKTITETQQAWLELTLNQMQSQHLIDHINGGFYRYTVDPEWQTPHFEKMGYDNALLANVYFEAGRQFQNLNYLQTGEATLNYMERHLYTPDTGLFKSSQSALDKQGREGGDYLFSKQQLQQRLPKAAFMEVEKEWGLDHPAPYELGWHPIPTQKYWPEIQPALKPPVQSIPSDDKHILSWNGLALSAYASAYHATQKKTYLNKGKQLAERLTALLIQPDPPRAITTQSQPVGLAKLEDYAYIIEGLRNLNQFMQDPKLRQTILDLTEKTSKRFLNADGWQTNSDLTLPGQKRIAALKDTATPSPTGLLECLTGSRGRNRNPLFAEQLRQNPLDFATYLKVLECQSE